MLAVCQGLWGPDLPLAAPATLGRGRSPSPAEKEENQSESTGFLSSSGGRTRTSGLRVMSPTSYQLLYPAMFGTAKVGNFFENPNFFKNS